MKRFFPYRVTAKGMRFNGIYIVGMWDGTDEGSYGWALPRGWHWLGKITKQWWT